jgi:hypothetical protein
MWIQHDAEPLDFGGEVTEYWNANYKGSWKGCDGPVAWPGRLPYLTLMDFFIGLYEV